jgi:sugar phosphate isomerase/epimerase
LFTVRQFTKTIEDIDRTFRKVVDIGYKAVQISAFGPVDYMQVASLVKDHGLVVGATHHGWDDFRNDLDNVIARNKAWGCDHPAVGGLPSEYRSLDGIKRFLDELGPVIERLAAQGMDFSYHNHNWEFARFGCPDNKTWMQTLLELSEGSGLNFEIDTYWVQAGGAEPTLWLKKCAGRMPVIHFKDMCITPEREIRMAAIGDGNLDWPGLLEAANAGGAKFAFIEQDLTYDRDPFDCLASSLMYLRRLGAC